GAPQLLGEDQREQVIGPLTPVSRVVFQADEPQLGHLAEHIVERDPFLTLPIRDTRVDLALDELAHQATEVVVLWREGHPATPRGPLRPGSLGPAVSIVRS